MSPPVTPAGVASGSPPDTRPSALVLGGLRRGALLVFLPVAAASQAIAWLEYAISNRFDPWSWFKVGLAYALTSVRVPFDAVVRGARPEGGGQRALETATLELAVGALTIAVVILAFRAGAAQARGLERQPRAAALAGSAVGLGFAVPMAVASVFVRLGLPGLGITALEPVLAWAFMMPLVVGGVVGAVGGLAAVSIAREERSLLGDPSEAKPPPPRSEAAARGGFTAFWWALGLAFVAFLILAVVQSGATRAYGRAIGSWGEPGAVVVVHHALLLPNQSALILAVTMGSPVDLTIGDDVAARASLGGIDVFGTYGDVLPDPAPGREEAGVDFPGWYVAFLAVPAVAAVLGGRQAGVRVGRAGERAIRGALGGVVFALLCTVAVWAAGVVIPLFVGPLGGAPGLSADPTRTAMVALAWGVAGGVMGASLPVRGRPPATT
jgi:hypothetical protein